MRTWPTALAVFAVALGLRLAHLAALRSAAAGTELFTLPLVDAAHHWREALAILDGGPILGDAVPWKSPGYSWFLAGLAALFGRSIAAIRWPLAVLGAANCAFLVVLARRALGLPWAAVAGLLAAGNGLLITYDTEPYHPALLVALNLGAFLLLTGERRRPLALVGAGVLLGLACLVHPAYLLPSALLAGWLWRHARREALGLVLVTAATIAPVTLSNLLVHREAVLVSWNGGINVFVGNHPTFDQRAGNGTQAWGRLLSAPVDAGIESVAERDRLYWRLTARRALAYPWATLRVLLHKAVVFFSPVEYASNFRIYDLAGRSPVTAVLLRHWGPLWVPFGLWAPAALIGLLWSWRARAGLTAPLGMWALGVMLTNVAVFNTARYRAPVVFFGCIWAAAAAGAAWRLAREDRGRLARGLAAYVVIAALLALDAVPQRDLPPPFEWHQAHAAAARGSVEEASAWAERAVARDPRSSQLRLAVSELYGSQGERRREQAHLHELLELPDLEPDVVDAAHEKLAASYFAQRRFDEAREELGRALAVGADDAVWHGYPHYPLGLGPVRSCILEVRLAEVELQRRDLARARELLASIRRDCPTSPGLTRELERLEGLAGGDAALEDRAR